MYQFKIMYHLTSHKPCVKQMYKLKNYTKIFNLSFMKTIIAK